MVNKDRKIKTERMYALLPNHSKPIVEISGISSDVPAILPRKMPSIETE